MEGGGGKQDKKSNKAFNNLVLGESFTDMEMPFRTEEPEEAVQDSNRK